MNCCQDDPLKEGKDPGKHQRFHKWIMFAGCALPVVLVAAFLFNGVDYEGWGNVLPILLVLICSLMHLILMPLMMGGKKHHH